MSIQIGRIYKVILWNEDMQEETCYIFPCGKEEEAIFSYSKQLYIRYYYIDEPQEFYYESESKADRKWTLIQ